MSFVAACVLTWMIFWMRRQSRLIKGDLEHRVDQALTPSRVGFALALVAFLAVLREGIEAALFLIAAATEESGHDVLIGAIIGLALAGVRGLPRVLGWSVAADAALLQGDRRGADRVRGRSPRPHRDVPPGRWRPRVVRPERRVRRAPHTPGSTRRTEVGKFLAAMFGWDPRPSIEQIVVWFGT